MKNKRGKFQTPFKKTGEEVIVSVRTLDFHNK